MVMYLGKEESFLNQKNALCTAREIQQQPDSWLKTYATVKNNQKELDGFLKPILKHQNLRIILTGAGTSGFIGDILAPYLTKLHSRVFESISTTNMVSSPGQYLIKELPTLIISYARSGNSPESIGAMQLANQLVENCYHLIITCNEDGTLRKASEESSNSYCLVMPKETLDESFAMTSSFSSMTVATLLIFSDEDDQFERCVKAGKHVLSNLLSTISDAAKCESQRLVFIGSGPLLGYAKESALKSLELSSGKVMCYSDSSLGFRHGPKSMIDEGTKIIIFLSSDDYTQKYDLSIYEELKNDAIANDILLLDYKNMFDIQKMNDVWLGLIYLLFCQIYSFYRSINMNISPDNPCPTGEVNRVVKGVEIYAYTP